MNKFSLLLVVVVCLLTSPAIADNYSESSLYYRAGVIMNKVVEELYKGWPPAANDKYAPVWSGSTKHGNNPEKEAFSYKSETVYIRCKCVSPFGKVSWSERSVYKKEVTAYGSIQTSLTTPRVRIVVQEKRVPVEWSTKNPTCNEINYWKFKGKETIVYDKIVNIMEE